MSVGNQQDMSSTHIVGDDVGSHIGHSDGGADAFDIHIDAFVQLRDPKAREAYLAAFAMAMAPDGVDPAIWDDWLSGKKFPGEGEKLKPPKTHGQGGSRDLQRQSQTVRRAADTVARARQSLDRAQDRVEEAEAALVKARNDDKASLQAMVSNELREKMAEVFAMGPAWTVLRAISAAPHTDEVADIEAYEQEPAKLKAAIDDLRDERRRDTRDIMDALSCWMGDFAFELELRQAILKVVKVFQDREPPRSRQDVHGMERLHALPGEVTADRRAILAELQ